MRLRECFDRHGCDRGKRHGYEAVYEPIFGAHRKTTRWIMEIGIYQGAGLLAWRDYFPRAELTGVDTFQRVKPGDIPMLGDPRVSWFMRDSTIDPPPREMGHQDFIFDDGAHDPASQRLTFWNYIPMLSDNGAYFIEDVDPRKPGYVELIDAISPYKVTHHDRRKTNASDSYILEIRC